MEANRSVSTVHFKGSRSVVSGLTWGQQWMWKAVVAHAPNYQHLNVTRTVEVASGRGIDDVQMALGRLLERHEALRTRFCVDETEVPRQTVVREGRIPIEIYEVGEDDVATASDDIALRLSDRSFTLPELPVRVAVVTARGVPRRIVLSVFHLAADGESSNVLMTDLTHFLSTRERTGNDLPGPPVVHPVDTALQESSPEGEKRSRKALRYWEKTISRFPERALPPVCGPHRVLRFQEFSMRSKSMYLATRSLAARYGVPAWSVALGLSAVLLAAKSGNDGCGLILFSHNRLDKRAGTESGTLVQDAPMFLRTAGERLPDVFRNAYRAAVFASMHARYDPKGLDDLLRNSTRSDGGRADLSCTVNIDLSEGELADIPSDIPASCDQVEIQNAVSETVMGAEGGFAHEDMSFFLKMWKEDGDRLRVHLRADTSRTPEEEIVTFLRDLERLTVAALGREEVVASELVGTVERFRSPCS
ncbi:condensation domain-containing protein [Streptomyces sp. NBC_01518]|uniref:condensation domain-containing protein n=1 Tax=Streptomyces sp. NBC_01518 TaxID=2903891 RepID=UPI003866BF39